MPDFTRPTRREFAAVWLPLALQRSKALGGIFPIMQTPFTPADAVDEDGLAREVEFLDRCRVDGMVWPQFASEYLFLSRQERLSGARTILSAARPSRTPVVIGIQAPDASGAAEYARHAEENGAAAVIALPPPGKPAPEETFEYYRAAGRASRLPLFAQTVGDMSPEWVARLAREVPTFRYLKDEAGPTLTRISWFARNAPGMHVFTGAHGRTLIDEMERGSAGTMPAASFADLYVAAWRLWHAGKRDEAAAAFGRVLLLVTEVQVYGIESLKYILYLRGVFRTYALRRRPAVALPASTGLEPAAAFDDTGKRVLAAILGNLGVRLDPARS